MENQREQATTAEGRGLTGRAALMTARIACLPNVNHKWSLSWAGNGRLTEWNS